MTRYRHRGVVEGFYGKAFDPEDRRWLVEAMGRWGMNRYLYAPKDDPLHRERWREPYPESTLSQFRSLVDLGLEVGVDVGFAVSPGLSIHYSESKQVAELVAKFNGFRDLGARFFGLALDDVPSTLQHEGDRAAFTSLAEAHATLANIIREGLGDDTTLWLVPTDYVGARGSDYLEDLGRRLEPTVEVGWTGRTVVSPTIEREEAEQRAAALGRPLLLWDNYPVSDGPMRPMLHLGPFRGRAPDLSPHVSGFMLNPMQLPRASGLALRSAAEYLNDPAGYDAEISWQAAALELGAGAPEAFEIFARAHRFSALDPGARDGELEDAFREVRGTSSSAALGRFATLLRDRRAAADALRTGLSDRRLLAEISPWLESHERECERMLAAADLLTALEDSEPGMEQVIAFSRFEGRLTRIPLGATASFGPRRVVYPQLASHEDEGARYGDDVALFLDHCLADEVVRFAEHRAVERLGVRVAAPTI